MQPRGWLVVAAIAIAIGAILFASTGSGLAALGISCLIAAVGVHLRLTLPLQHELQQLIPRIEQRAAGRPIEALHSPMPQLEALDAAVSALLEQLCDEARVQQRQGRLVHEVLQASPVGIVLLDARGQITTLNDAFRGMFRLRGEPIGKRPIEVVPSADVHLVVEEAKTRGTAERAFVTESSDLIARAEALTDGILLRIEDITGRREAERSRTDFVANVSHELRTPLAAILGYLETMMQDEERIPEDLRQMLQTVHRNARRLRDLFEDLLRLHRIEARRRELPMERQRLLPILEEAVGPTVDRAAMCGQRLALECPKELIARVNPDALVAIVGNLASNASSYTPPGGHIQVRALQGEDGVRIEVSDDGIGIPRRHHERIFERFYRVDTARSRAAGGTGLGLAIVKHYARACGFHLKLESDEGQGSTFTVALEGPVP
ncbi:MAG TPA: PAS domain-containing protein [Deltaproteobacteria bacterium]|nr:PAS domain-containing protein [Deltaproteobacteria bacterium]